MSYLSADDFPMTMEVEAGMPAGCPAVGVSFGLFPLRDQVKSDTEGYEVFVDVVHVRIAVPGETRQVFFQPASETHKKRFPQAWKAFQDRDHTPLEGLPIEQWAAVTRGVALTLKSLNIPTVEAMSQVHDGNIDKVPNGRELKAKAVAFLAQAHNGASVMKDAKEKQELRDQIASLQAQITAAGIPAAEDAVSARKPRARASA